jgi:hypothetical protein
MISPTGCDPNRCQEQLAKFGRSALPHLLERVADVDPRVAASAVRCLKQQTLTEMLKEPEGMVGMVSQYIYTYIHRSIYVILCINIYVYLCINLHINLYIYLYIYTQYLFVDL